MSLTEILSEVKKLTPDEKEQVFEVLRQSNNFERNTPPDKQGIELLRRLQKKGMLKSIPTRRPTPGDFEPVSIGGKPLSETIIEERR